MTNDYKSSGFRKLLDKLQQESWQLELIISGFAIYGLWQSIETLQIEYIKAVKLDEALYGFIMGATINAVVVLIILLLFHVIVRGLWIGTLGLRYVSGEIDYDNLGYTSKFTAFLKEKVGSFDRYISRLENICSTIFALAFLMVFYFVSYFLAMGIVNALYYFIVRKGWLPETTANIIFAVILVPYLLGVLILFIDFLTLGYFKRHRFLSKIYFPIYRFYGILTLSFLYRPLVYNFLDQKRARWVAVMVMPVYIIVAMAFSLFGNINSNFQMYNQETSEFYTNKLNYEDLLTDEKDMVQFVSIPSKVIERPSMRVFIGHNKFLEDRIIESDTTLKPEKDRRGYLFQPEKMGTSNGVSTVKPDQSFLKKQEKFLIKMGTLYKLKIDSTLYKSEYVFTTNQKDRFGFETYLDLKGLENGKHLLRFIGPGPRQKMAQDTLMTIPFWYFKN